MVGRDKKKSFRRQSRLSFCKRASIHAVMVSYSDTQQESVLECLSAASSGSLGDHLERDLESGREAFVDEGCTRGMPAPHPSTWRDRKTAQTSGEVAAGLCDGAVRQS
jgi:hypothetical protein